MFWGVLPQCKKKLKEKNINNYNGMQNYIKLNEKLLGNLWLA